MSYVGLRNGRARQTGFLRQAKHSIRSRSLSGTAAPASGVSGGVQDWELKYRVCHGTLAVSPLKDADIRLSVYDTATWGSEPDETLSLAMYFWIDRGGIGGVAKYGEGVWWINRLQFRKAAAACNLFLS
jgi:hypothetical protein